LWALGLGSTAFGAASPFVPLSVVALGEAAFALGVLAAVATLGDRPGALVSATRAVRRLATGS
jgi:hypothetical protein